MPSPPTNRPGEDEKSSSQSEIVGCTIVTQRTIPSATVLAQSFRRFHPNARFFALVLDLQQPRDDSRNGIEWITLDDLSLAAAERHALPIICDAGELIRAVKPALLQTLLSTEGGVVAYFEHDIKIFGSLDEMVKLARQHSIVLFPYLSGPAPADLRIDGVYNTGVIAIAGGSEPFLGWWLERTKTQSYKDPEGLLAAEQLSLDSAPTLFPNYAVLSAPGWNVSYRNLSEGALTRIGERYEVSGKALRIFHFSGYDPRRSHLLSAGQGNEPRILLSREPAIAQLCEEYREELLGAGFASQPDDPNNFLSLSNGVVVDRHVRRVYREALEEFRNGKGAEPPKPFASEDPTPFIEWLNEPVTGASAPVTRYLSAVREARPDVQLAFPDPIGADAAAFLEWFVLHGRYDEQTHDALVPPLPQLSTSISAPAEEAPNEELNVVGYFRAELGIGEAARILLTALDASNLPYQTIPYGGTVSRQEHPFQPALDSAVTGDINLICVNADQLPRFVRQNTALFRPGRYSIGVWFWEVEDFPAELHPAFDYVDEIWVASEFVRQALVKVSPKPVFKFPLPIVAPKIDSRLSRADLGLPERFTFLFSFDFLSVLERKNAVGLIEAFKRAFAPGEGPALLIKTINGDKRILEMEKLLHAAGDHPDILIRDGYVSALEKNTLMARCDCYVSLHRSEGFGLTVAEAMALGRPAIATAYSGNLEFMNAENSFLCGYTVRPIGPGAEPYPASSHWAEPDLDEAAALMRRACRHPEEAAARAAKALSDLEQFHSPAAAGKIIASQLALIRRQRPFSGDLAAARLAKKPLTARELREAVAATEAALTATEAALAASEAALAASEDERRELEQRMRTIHERLRAEARLAQTEAAALSARLEKAQRETWESKVRRAAVTAQLRQRDQVLEQIQSSPVWKAAKPFWKLHRRLSDEKSKAEKVPRENLLFAIDAPETWTTSREIVVIRGWCFAGSGTALAGLRAKLGKKSFLAQYGLPRADLAALHPTFPEAAHAGFSIEVKGVPQGVSSVSLEAIVQGRDWQPFAERELVRTPDPNSRASTDGSSDGISELVAGSDGHYTMGSLTLYPGVRPPQLLRTLKPLFDHHCERALAAKPFFSIITPTHNTKPQWLAEAAASLLKQSFPDWEWCIVDDGSESRELREMLEKFTAFTPHVRVKFVPAGGISAANNHGLEMARGDYVGFLDHDDLLDSGALAAMAEKFKEGFDAVYSDEDKLNESRGELVERFFKPDWSPEYFRGVMYVGHLLCVRREIARKIRFDSTFDGVQDFEFMLRVGETGARVGHIPRVLYHWRKTPGSISETPDAKPRIGALQQQAVTNHLARVELPARAVQCIHAHRLKVVPAGRSVFPLVSIIIPTRDAPELLGRCLKSIFEKSSYPKMEVILMDNETTDEEALWLMGQYPVRRIHFPNPFNFSRANNVGARHAAGEFLVFLNNDTEIVAEDWLQQLLYYAEQPDVGAVGALLLYDNRTVQHAGVVLGIRGTADHAMRGFPGDGDGYAGSLACAREVSAVTAACSMMRKSLFLEIGGFNEHFFTAYQDVDLCLRLRDRGLRIIYTPQAVVLHHEWASRKTYYDMVDRMLLLDRWEPVIERGDPYYNPNLELEAGDYSRRL